jgi:glycosyltransferase involved in cell wall biosynthesis
MQFGANLTLRVFHVFSGSKNALEYNAGGVETFLNNMLTINSRSVIHSMVIGRKRLILPQLIKNVTIKESCFKSASAQVHFPFFVYLFSNIILGTTISSFLLLTHIGHRRDTDRIIIHAHDPTIGASLFFFSKIILRNTTYVCQFHSEYTNRLKIMLPNTFLSQITVKLCYLMEKICLMKTDKVIAVNTNIQRYLLSLGCLKNEITQIPVFIDIKQRTKCQNACIISKLGIPKEQFIITSIGRLTREKNVQLVISAFLSLDESDKKRFTLLIVGAGCQLNALKSMTKNSSKVHFLGHRTDVDSILNCTDLFVLPSLTEGFPFSLLEAMAHGKTIIASDIPPIAGIVKNEEDAILIDPNNAEQLSGAVLKLYKDSELRKRIALNAKAKAQQYDVTAIIPEILNCYKT